MTGESRCDLLGGPDAGGIRGTGEWVAESGENLGSHGEGRNGEEFF